MFTIVISSIGKTIRVNTNAGGGLDGYQQNTWEDNPRYIWTNNDSKNADFTYYIRCSGKISGHCIALSQSLEPESILVIMIHMRHVVNLF